MRRTRRPRRPGPAPARASTVRWPALDQEIHGDLNDFARAIDDLSSGDLERLVAFWEMVDAGARDDAHQHAQEAALRLGRRDVIHALQEDIIAWGGPSQAARAGAIEAWLPVATLQYGRRRALPALIDTALALAVQDDLDDDDFETLFGPWRDAMGDDDIADEADRADDADEADDRPPDAASHVPPATD